ncbi:MAG TPA: hypothetical protein VIA06_16570 [Candidatus Dormibacteraeota bacterium]|jgi:hypothetical protein|nr:hypothetical protein [Candidatus Dormibacteraeota bacterium]
MVAGLLLLLLIAGCASQKTPVARKPSPTPSPAPTPCPVQAGPDVWVRGCVTLEDGDNVDLDGGQVDVPTYDLVFQGGVLTVAPGTEAAYLGVRDFNSVGPSDIGAANLGTTSFDVDQLQKGGILAVQTGHGRPSKVLFDTVSTKGLNLSFFTYSSYAAVSPTPTPSHHHPTPTPTPSPTSTPTPSG